MNGDFDTLSSWGFENTSDPVVQFITQRLNAKHCPKGVVTGGCKHDWYNQGLRNL